MTLRIAYCDDEPVQAIYLRESLDAWAARTGNAYDLSVFSSARAFLFEHRDQFPFDLLLLDIEMEGLDGMALSRRIRKIDAKIPVAFLTNRREYALEGYEVGALRYLIKPLSPEKLEGLLAAVTASGGPGQGTLIFTQDREQVKAAVEDLCYLESQGHYTILHLQNGTVYSLKEGLSELAQRPQLRAFAQTHRSYLVNLSHVIRVGKDQCVLDSGEALPVSRSCYAALCRAFIDWNKE